MVEDKELSVHINDKIKTMRKNTNDKLRLAAKMYLLKHYEIMIHLKKIENKNEE